MEKFKPQILPPLDVEDKWAILDYKAVVKHCQGMGRDPDCLFDSVTGREVNSAEHTVRAFLDAYLIPILDNGFTPRQILVAHDDGHDYRSRILPEYKKKRDDRKTDEKSYGPEIGQEYDKASDSIKRILAFIGATQLKVSGVEGDDIIAYLCKIRGPKSIYTVDADLLRLCNPDTLLNMKNNPVYYSDFELDCLPKNMHGFVKPFLDAGVDTSEHNIFTHLTLYKSIVGDTSDEYKGIKGYGDKAWEGIVKEFEVDGLASLADIVNRKDWTLLKEYLDHYDENFNGSQGHKYLAKLYEERSAWRVCWLVADLHPELCWKPYRSAGKTRLTEITWFKRVPSKARIRDLLAKNFALEFMEDLERYLPVEWLIDASNFEEGDIDEFADLCEESPFISFDYEGFSRNEDWVANMLANTSMKGYVDVRGQEMTGISINFGSNLQYTCYITVNHADKEKNLSKEVVRKFLEAIPVNKIRVAHNSQFEEVVTFTNLDGYTMPVGSVHDTAVMSVYDDERKETHRLKDLSKKLLGYTQATYEETLAAAGATNMRQLTSEQVLKYGLDDSTCTAHLYDLMRLSLMLQDCWDFYRENEPYVNHRLAMSFVTGVDIDWQRHAELAGEDANDSAEKMSELREILEENCSKVNREAAERYFSEEKKYLEASIRSKYMKMDREKALDKLDSVAEEIEKSDYADDVMMEIAERIRAKIPQAKGKKAKAERDLSNVDHTVLMAWGVKYELHKKFKIILEGSVYVPYVKHVHHPVFTPTVKNLDEVATKLGLTPPGTVAKGKLNAWEAAIRDIDFESDRDLYNELNDKQKQFVDLLRSAKEKFAPADRTHEDFVKFSDFCNEVVGAEAKVTYTGTELNLGSPDQMKALMYCMLDLPVRLRGMASQGRKDLGFWEGSPSTDKLAQDTALAEDIVGVPGMKWKEQVINLMKGITECNTRTSLYHNSYPYLRHPETGRLHPNVRNCGTVTRRPSGSQPNILQVSKHQKKGVMRSIFIPPRGYCVIPIDFSGQELRIQASETKDFNLLSCYLGPDLTKQYLNGEVVHITYDMVKDKTNLRDLHGLTASGITEHFGLDEAGELVPGGIAVKWKPADYEEYMAAYSDKEHEFHSLANKVRKKPAKATNFLLSYGGTEQTLSHRLIIPEKVAEGIMTSTFEVYPGIPVAQDQTLKFAKEHGFSVTAYGNRRHASEDIFSKSRGPVNAQVRQLYNYRIQGCAADILKVVLSSCEKRNIWEKYSAVMVAPVYDEVVAFVPFDHAWDFTQDMREIMNITPPGHAVPMVADVSVGPNWQIQYELGHQPTREEFDAVMSERVIPEANAIWDRIDSETETL